ncbi:hypothetical protein KP79_PYT22390 [Mizuhopecten yessoensis]|uniref:Uncharacterized protein n=1 Tax=Mizuhopecten yessoensis TaxID=6573 RepID=A0A210PHR1_MIZYE|nr:hypothetical protein KP79_PYT22390 [Mizuhopecten yessoensis]
MDSSVLSHFGIPNHFTWNFKAKCCHCFTTISGNLKVIDLILKDSIKTRLVQYEQDEEYILATRFKLRRYRCDPEVIKTHISLMNTLVERKTETEHDSDD